MKYFVIFLVALMIISLVVFINVKQEAKTKLLREDRIEVYDENDELITKAIDESEMNYLVGAIEKTISSKSDEEFNLITLPQDAKKMYTYKFITIKDGEEFILNFFVYKNYKYITLNGLPVLGDITWELSDSEYEKLTNPKSN